MAANTVTSRVAMALWRRQHPEWAVGRPGHTLPRLDIGALDVPRAVADRVRIKVRSRGAEPPPWITEDSLEMLETLLKPTDRVVEWGSGGTTPWFASRVEHVVSVEGSPEWHGILRARLDAAGVRNVDLHLVSSDELGYETPEHEKAYVGAVPDLAPESFDVAFVDGEYRDGCALRALDLLSPGGILVLDNAETYLPSTTRSPWTVDAPCTAGWEQFAQLTADWRSVWTTNGAWDTALWFKPAA